MIRKDTLFPSIPKLVCDVLIEDGKQAPTSCFIPGDIGRLSNARPTNKRNFSGHHRRKGFENKQAGRTLPFLRARHPRYSSRASCSFRSNQSNPSQGADLCHTIILAGSSAVRVGVEKPANFVQHSLDAPQGLLQPRILRLAHRASTRACISSVARTARSPRLRGSRPLAALDHTMR